MSDTEKTEIQIEKTLSVQIIDKMIDKLKQSGLFSDSMLSELRTIDLTNKSSVKEIITKQIKYPGNENLEIGN